MLPISSAQSPFVLHQAGSLTPTQEAILEDVKAIYAVCLKMKRIPNSF